MPFQLQTKQLKTLSLGEERTHITYTRDSPTPLPFSGVQCSFYIWGWHLALLLIIYVCLLFIILYLFSCRMGRMEDFKENNKQEQKMNKRLIFLSKAFVMCPNQSYVLCRECRSLVTRVLFVAVFIFKRLL